jgi:4-aminobutyrate aminotransferase
MSTTIETTRRHESTAVNTFSLGIDPPEFVRGTGACLWTEDGRRYIDLVCGSAVTNLGHGHPAHLAAIQRQLDTGILHTGTRLPSAPRARLYEALGTILPPELSTVHLANSGSEAIETAIKAAQYATRRRNIVAFQGGYHGRTLGALAVTASQRLRDPFAPLPGEVTFAPYPYPLRPSLPNSTAQSIGTDCLAYLSELIASPVSGTGAPSAVIIEAIQGVSGVIIPPLDFLRNLRALCDRAGILLIVDEIWNGFGRTGEMFAFDHAMISPDIVTLGKSLSGSLPLSAVVARPEILHGWPPGMHTSTFQGNPLACAAAVATIETIRQDDLLSHSRNVLETTMRAKLETLGLSDGVAEVRVIGAMAGVELVDANGDPDGPRLKRLQRRCQDLGVLVYGGGWHGNVLMLVPPLVISSDELGEALDKVVTGLANEPPTGS